MYQRCKVTVKTADYWHWLVMSVCCLTMLSACHRSEHPMADCIPVQAMTLRFTSIPIEKDYIGFTKSMDAVDIRARVEGFLEKMLFIEGKRVKKGSVLYIIDQKPFIAKLDEALGKLDHAEAASEYARIQYLRMKDLVRKGDISKTKYDEVYSAYKIALSDTEVAKAQVETAKINLSYCSLKAPFDGLIGKKYVDLGNLVGAGESTLLAKVVRLDPIYVEFNPTVNDYSEFIKYRENAPFSASVSLPDYEQIQFEGKLNLVNNEADVKTSTILMRADIKNPNLFLLPNMYVNIKLRLADNIATILLPSAALIQTQEKRSVWVVNQQHQVEMRSVEIAGEYQNNSIIKSGLKKGDVVIIKDVQKIQQGMNVTPLFSTPGMVLNG